MIKKQQGKISKASRLKYLGMVEEKKWKIVNEHALLFGTRVKSDFVFVPVSNDIIEIIHKCAD